MLLLRADWRDLVLAEARTWLHTPYQHKGMVKGVGVDCGGLLYAVYGQFFGPFNKPFPTDYAPDWALHQDGEIYLDFIMDYVEPVPGPVPAGIAVFQVGRNYSHGAVCSHHGKYIHSWGRNGQGAVVETGLNFFKLGNSGKPRAVRYFDVRKEWLLSHH
jgi:cell wall-associated NlpC family hydrolase